MQDLDPSDICKNFFLNPLKRIRVIIRTPTHGRTDRRTDGWTDEQYESSIPPLNFVSGGIIKFSYVNVYLISKFMFRVCKGDVPEIFRTYFRFNSEIHNHFTRQCDYLHVPIVKSNLGKWNIRYRGVIIWNYIISKGVDLDISEAVFVKMVKRIFCCQWYVKNLNAYARLNVTRYLFDVSTHLSFDSIVIQCVFVFVMTCSYCTCCVHRGTVLTTCVTCTYTIIHLWLTCGKQIWGT